MPVRKLMLLGVAVAALILAVPSWAAETERDAYVQRVEPICKANAEANRKILAGARKKVKEGELAAASRQVARAAKALKRTWRELSQVPRPQSDAAALTRWLTDIKAEAKLFEEVAQKLAKGQKGAAQKLVVRLYSNANRTNNDVLEFEFRYCRLQPSKYL
ncbi:MAG: hypothetical protein ACM3Q9_01095 [Methanosarcina sp.]